MRSCLRRLGSLLALAAASLASAGSARADGELSLRSFYYKERATRVVQPMLDAKLDIGEHGTVDGHLLVDAITSASVGAGAAGDPFTEYRKEGGVGYLHELEDGRVGASARYSHEPDYQSVFVSGRGEIDLAHDNAVLGLTTALGFDDISNAGAVGGMGVLVKGELSTIMTSLSFSQILSKNLVAGATYDLIYLDGFLANPYRSVAAGGMLVPERMPDSRLRHAWLGSLRGFVPATSTTLVGSYRFYADDWGVRAHTPELRVVQPTWRGLVAHLRLRWHHQGEAEFFEDIYDSASALAEPYLTDDEKLSAFDTLTFGLKLTGPGSFLGLPGRLATVRGEASLEYVHQTSDFGDAVVANLAIIVPFQY
jgi:hypothetical protein